MNIGRIGCFDSMAAIRDALSCILKHFLNHKTDIIFLLINLLLMNNFFEREEKFLIENCELFIIVNRNTNKIN